MKEIIIIMLSAILVENFVLIRFIGVCPFLGVSTKFETAMGMGGAVIFVITLSSIFSWVANEYLLKPFGLEFLQLMVFILIIGAFVQLVESFLKKKVPPLYKALGIYLPLISTNCAVLGVCLLNMDYGYNLLNSTIFGIGASVGFTFALVLFSGVRERMSNCDIPESLKGLGSAMIAAGLVSMAFFGFQGLFK